MKSGIVAASVFHPATGTAVQFNNVRELNCQKRPMEGDRNPMGQAVYGSDDSLLELEAYDFAGAAQLEAWLAARTPLQFVAQGVEQHVLWYESCPLEYLEIRTPSRLGLRNTVALSLAKKGHGRHKIYKHANLLHHLGWSDVNTDGVADGYVTSGNPGASFAGGQQTLTASADGYLVGKVIFPISGAPLTLSEEDTQLHPSGADLIRIVGRSFANALLNSTSTTITGTGRNSVGQTTSAGIYTIQADLGLVTGPGASGSRIFRNPALRLDGSSAYVAY